MRHFYFLSVLTSISVFTSPAFAQGIPNCDDSIKSLYKEIQIYNQTEKAKPQHGLVGPVLQKDLGLHQNKKMPLKDKIHTLETTFVKCNLALSLEEQMLLEQEIDDAKATVLR